MGEDAPKPTFAPARRRFGKRSSEQRHVNVQRLEVAAAVASASDESDVIGGNFAAPKLLTSRRMPILQHRWHFG